jgi:hypothetical protein
MEHGLDTDYPMVGLFSVFNPCFISGSLACLNLYSARRAKNSAVCPNAQRFFG